MQASSNAHHQPTFCGLEHFTACIAVFDSRLGQKEGQEDDKVLAFFPAATVPPTTRTMIVGLAQALNGFTDTFKQGEAEHDDSCVVMEAQHHTWVLHECEPKIWMLVVVSKAWLGSSCTHAALRGYMHNVYALLVVLHGPLQHTLDQVDAVPLARSRFQSVLDEVGRLLVSQGPRMRLASAPVALTREASALVNPLGLHTGIPLLVTPEPSYLGAQCLSGRLMNLTLQLPAATTTPSSTDQLPDRPVLGVHIAWHGMPIWSTLDREDAHAVHALMQRALLPAAGIGRQKPNAIKTALAAAAAAGADATYRLASTAVPTTTATTAVPLTSQTATSSSLLNPKQWMAVPPIATAVNNLGMSGPSISNPSTDSIASPFQSNNSAAPAVVTTSQAGLAVAAASAASRTAAGAAAAAASWLSSQGSGPLPTAAAATSGANAVAGTGAAGQPQAGWLLPAVQMAATTDSAITAPPSPFPDGWSFAQVWLKAESSFVGLLPFYHGALMVAVFLRPGLPATLEFLKQTQEVLIQNMSLVSSQLQANLPPSTNLWHQQGYRYCHEDAASDSSRATPIKKVTTLSEPVLRLAAHTRNKADHWRRTCGRLGRDDNPAGVDDAPRDTDGEVDGTGQGGTRGDAAGVDTVAEAGAGLAAAGDQEVIVRTAADAWVVTRRAESRQLHVAVDQAPVASLLGVSAHVQRLCDRLYPGYFIGFG